jgi:hypothetical protein
VRTLSNSVLAALIVAALFWGNCFSCPQLLLTLAQKSAHGCCHRSAPVQSTCSTAVLQHFVKADPAPVAAPAAAPIRLAATVPAPVVIDAPAPVLTLHSPPNPLALTSLLRI